MAAKKTVETPKEETKVIAPPIRPTSGRLADRVGAMGDSLALEAVANRDLILDSFVFLPGEYGGVPREVVRMQLHDPETGEKLDVHSGGMVIVKQFHLLTEADLPGEVKFVKHGKYWTLA